MQAKKTLKVGGIFIGAIMVVAILSIISIYGDKELGLFPEMLVNDIEKSISLGRTWFYIFERDDSCECSVLSAITDDEVKLVIDKAVESGMNIRIIIPPRTSSGGEITAIETRNPLVEIGMVSQQTLDAIPEKSDFRKNLYLSGSFICQELKCSNDNRKYVKRWRYAPRFAMILKNQFERLWEKSMPI